MKLEDAELVENKSSRLLVGRQRHKIKLVLGTPTKAFFFGSGRFIINLALTSTIWLLRLSKGSSMAPTRSKITSSISAAGTSSSSLSVSLSYSSSTALTPLQITKLAKQAVGSDLLQTSTAAADLPEGFEGAGDGNGATYRSDEIDD